MAFPSLTDISKARTNARQFGDGTTYALDFVVNGQTYTFVPSNVASNGGVTAGDNTYLLPYFTDANNKKAFDQNAQSFDLSSNTGLSNYLQSQGQSTSGYLIPSDQAPIDSQVLTQPTSTLGGSLSGLVKTDGGFSYGITGGHGQRYLTTTGEVHDPYTTYSSLLGDTFGGLGQGVSDFLNTDVGKAALMAATAYAGGAFDASPVSATTAADGVGMSGFGADAAANASTNVGGSGALGGALSAPVAESAAPIQATQLPTITPETPTGLMSPGVVPQEPIAQLPVTEPVASSQYSLTSPTSAPAFTGTTGQGLDLFAPSPLGVSEGVGLQLPGAANLTEMGAGQGLLGTAAGSAGGLLGETGIGSVATGLTNTITGAPLGQNLANIDTGYTGLNSATTPIATDSIAQTAAQKLATNTIGRSLMATLLGTDATNAALGNLVGGGLQGLGGLLGGQSTADAQAKAAAAYTAAGQQAQNLAQFRPVGVTTRFGGSQFTVNPTTGQLESAGYTLSPEALAQQNQLMALANQGLTQAQGAQAQYAPLQQGAQNLFNLGQQYISQSPEQVAQDYMTKQLALLQPGREQQSAQLMNQLQQTGRTGLSVAQGGQLGAANPEMQALANARAMQDLQLAAQANQAGQQNVNFGVGLLGQGAGALGQYYGGQQAAYAPYQAALTGATGLEALGQNPLTLGTGLGTAASNANANAARLGYAGAAQAAAQNLPANAYNPYASVLSGLGGSGLLSSALGSSLGSTAIGSALGNWLSGTGSTVAQGGGNADIGVALAGLPNTGDVGLFW